MSTSIRSGWVGGRAGVFLGVLAVMVIACSDGGGKSKMGYDKVKWGASVEAVRKAYGIGDNIALKGKHGDDPNIASLTQENVSESITERTFLFNRWNSGQYRLYRVWVVYKNDASDSTVQDLKNLLIDRFGDVTDYDSTGQTPYYDGGGWTQKVSLFGKHSPELVVELVLIERTGCFGRDGTFTGREVRREYCGFGGSRWRKGRELKVSYTWKKFRDEYMARTPEVGL